MTQQPIKANQLFMDRGNYFIFNGKNVWAPLARCKVSEIEDYLDAVAGDVVTARCKVYTGDTIAKQARQLASFKRRIANLSPRYLVTTWKPLVIDGYTQAGIFTATISRVLKVLR